MAPISRPSTVGVQDPLRILVADDNDLLRAAVRGLLGSLGHSVEVANDGREALAAGAREAFDLVFLDMEMPVMGGLEAARLLSRGRGDRRGPRIIGFSAECEERGSYSAAGIDEFLIKPVRLADLVRVTRRHDPR